MERRGQTGCAQSAAHAVFRIRNHVESILQVERVAHTGALHEVHEFGAACKEHVLPVVDDVSIDFERRCAPAQQSASFKYLDVPPGLLEMGRRSQPRKSAADDGYAGLSHDPSTTRSFSLRESAARSRSGNCGSRSILRRMPS